MGEFHRRQRDPLDVELSGERLHRVPVVPEFVAVGEQGLPQRRTGQFQPARLQVGDGGQLLHRHLLVRHAFDRGDHPLLARLGEGDRGALPSRAADPADAVDVDIGGAGHVVVDDVGQLVDVEAARGDVGGHDEIGGAGPEPAHDTVALLLIHAAVQGLRPVVPTVHGLGEPVDLLPGAAEHHRGLRRLEVEYPAERGGLVPARHEVGGLPDHGGVTAHRLGPGELDALRVGQVPAHQTGDPGRHRGREEHGLPLVRGALEDGVDVLGEAHVEHLVGLVQHDRVESVQPERAAGQMVQCAPGGGHHHVGPLFEGPQLPAHRLAAVDGHDPDTEVPTVAVERRADLGGELPGRDEDQSARRRAALAVGETVQQRQRERGGLARAGGGLTDEVPPRQQRGHGRPLDRGGFGVPELRECPGQRRVQRQIGESVEVVGHALLLRRTGDHVCSCFVREGCEKGATAVAEPRQARGPRLPHRTHVRSRPSGTGVPEDRATDEACAPGHSPRRSERVRRSSGKRTDSGLRHAS